MSPANNLTHSQENRNTAPTLTAQMSAIFERAFCSKPTPTNPLSRRRFLTGLIGLIPLAAARPLSGANAPDELPADIPPTALELYRTFLDLHRAGDDDAAAMCLGDCVFALPEFQRGYVVNLVGSLAENGGTK